MHIYINDTPAKEISSGVLERVLMGMDPKNSLVHVQAKHYGIKD